MRRFVAAMLLCAAVGSGCEAIAPPSYYSSSRPHWHNLVGEEYTISLEENEFDYLLPSLNRGGLFSGLGGGNLSAEPERSRAAVDERSVMARPATRAKSAASSADGASGGGSWGSGTRSSTPGSVKGAKEAPRAGAAAKGGARAGKPGAGPAPKQGW